MAVLFEYAVVFAISMGVAGASVMLVGGATPGLTRVAESSRTDQIAGAARLAVAEGRSVSVLLPLSSTLVSCHDGSLTVSMGGDPWTYALGYPCSFDSGELDGTCTLSFSATGDVLELRVAC